MGGSFDPDAIKASVSLVDVIGSYVDLRQNGNEYEACCPFHKEKTPSFRVVPGKGFYHCFGCGAHGDVLDFVRDITGCTFQEACEALGGEKLPEGKPIKKRPAKERVDYYAGLEPKEPPHRLAAGKPLDLYNPKRESTWKGAIPEAVYPYRDGYVLRFVIDDKKLTPQVRYTQHGWTMMPLPEPRALYGLPLHEGRQVLVVEGEKAADAARAVIGDKMDVVSWCGGTNGVDKADWSPLYGRNIVVIPDRDDEGLKAMRQVVKLAKAASVKYIVPPPDLPKGWDVADRKWNAPEFVAWCKKNARPSLPETFHVEHQPEPAPEQEPAPETDPSPPDDRPQPPVDTYDPPPDRHEDDFDQPYRILGHYQGTRFYLPNGTQQVVELSPSAHTKANLMALAPLQHWEACFPGKNAPDWDRAINMLLQLSSKEGIFNADCLRGRGAWIDQGRAVVHMGQTVYVDGQPMRPEQVPSKYIYQQDIDLGVELSDPASNAEANKLVQICKRLSWEADLSATLLAGWCVIAPLCGVLPWRPHIWVTGPAGSGKSTIMDSIIKAVVGDMLLKFEGKTTEAGIRQSLGIDARPVVYDEAEAEDRNAIQRLKGVLDFARVCSSGGTVAKGTTSGSSMLFSARAAFCFSSINTSIKHFADESRISQLVLKIDYRMTEDHYEKLKTDILDTFTRDYSSRMFARSVANMATLQANCVTFTEAANLHFRSRRIADQIGAMLAGAYLCHSTGRITRQEALEWIQKHNWEEHTAVGSKADSERLLSKIATHRIRVQTRQQMIEASVGEAIVVVNRENYTHPLDFAIEELDAELKRLGILVKDHRIMVANSSDPMRKVLADTPWESSWSRTLSEFQGSEKHGTTYFSPGIKVRAVSIPIGVLVDG